MLDVLRDWIGIHRREVREGSDSVEVTCHLRSSPSRPAMCAEFGMRLPGTLTSYVNSPAANAHI